MSALSALQGTASVFHSNLIVTLPIPKGNTDTPNQVYIVTGANTGLGFESSQHLSRLGVGKLIMAVRTPSKGEEAKKRILATTKRPDSSIEVWPLDMDSYSSIQNFAEHAAAQLSRIDGVLANAGIMTTKYNVSEGSEQTLHVNVISTFFFYMVLLPKMRESAVKTGVACRFVIPNSALHYVAPLAELSEPKKKDQKPSQGIIARLNDPDKADMAGRYNLSKLLVLYAVREFAERARKNSSGKPLSIVNTPNPSFCKSDLARENADSAAFRAFERVMARTTEEGSRTLVDGLLAGEESNGHYLNNCHAQEPACHVTNAFGQKVQKQFFQELLDTYESVQPGISANL